MKPTQHHSKLAFSIKQLLTVGLVLGTVTSVSIAKGSDFSVSSFSHESQHPDRTTIIYSREQILRSGASSAAEFIRSLPSNTSGSLRPSSGSSAQGNSAVALRGFGSNRTLVLIDGRRMPKSPSLPSTNDLSLLPIGAIERIEISTIGASAIYGADAVGGVVNIITRSDFQGAEIMLGGAEVSIPNNGGEREQGSIIFGAKSARSNLVVGVSWNDREIIFQRDLPWNIPEDSFYGNNFTTLSNGFDNFNFTSLPYSCSFPNTGFSQQPYSDSLNGTRCVYDFTSVSADEASTENKSFYANANHEINDAWSLWAKTLFSQSESFGRYAPTPDSSYFSTPLSVDSPNNPTNPNSPAFDASLGLSPQAVNWWHRFDPLGNRDSTVTSQMSDMSLGIKGQIGRFDVGFAARHTDNRTSDVGENFLLRSVAQAMIENGAYNLVNPYGTPENILNAMKITLFRDGKYDQDELFASVSFNAFDMKSGPVTVHIGAEHRQEKYADLYDPQSEAEQVGGTVGNSAIGNRDVNAFYFTATIPVDDKVNIDLAGRYDNHSDFGDYFSPKLAINWQPSDALSLFATYSEDYAAPDLAKLNQKPNTTFISVPPSDVILTSEIRANPFLKAETIDQFSLGLNYQPIEWLNFHFNYWQINLKDRIRLFGPQSIITFINNGLLPPTGLNCFSNSAGQYTRCVSGYGNRGTIDHSGYNFNVQTQFDLLGGDFNSQFQMTHLLNSQVDKGIDFTSRPGTPPIRAVLTNNYIKNNWSFTYQLNFISEHSRNENYPQSPAPSWITHDFQLNYHSSWQGLVTVGMKNAGEKSPPIGDGIINNRGYDFNLYDGFGRIVYARYTQTF